jgi:F-type H+-transporting ATPase subunit gamma
LFLSHKVDQVDIFFNRFINTLSQKPVAIEFLPISEISGLAATEEEQKSADTLEQTPEFLFEPRAADVLGALLPHYLNFYMYQILLEAKASEQSARMVAMKNATDNANQIIKDLTLEYNKLRQSSITKELLEIATAQMALD